MARQRGRIAKYMGATISGNTETNATNNKVRHVKQFILYCIRNGIETANLFGARINKEMKQAYDIFLSQYHNRDPNEINYELNKCQQYIEDNKTRIGKTRRRNIVDTIIDLIQEHNIETTADWNLTIPAETKHQLLKEFGLSVDNYVQRLIRTNKHEKAKYYKNVPFTQLQINIIQTYMDTHAEYENTFYPCITWIHYLLQENKIDLIEFLTWAKHIKDKRYTKIKTLVLEGPTNAGKSLIADTLFNTCKPEEVSRERDNSGFHFDQLPEASGVIFEEPCITPINVGTWKSLFEGKQVKTDIKHKDKEGIRRLPIWITTANPITTNIDTYEANQIRQRLIKSVKDTRSSNSITVSNIAQN